MERYISAARNTSEAISRRQIRGDSLSRSAVILYDLAKGSIDTLSGGRKAYAGGRFSAAGDKVLFAATDEEEKIPTGTPVTVIGITKGTTLIVTKHN